jgi:hypothetical protein
MPQGSSSIFLSTKPSYHLDGVVGKTGFLVICDARDIRGLRAALTQVPQFRLAPNKFAEARRRGVEPATE